MKYAVRLLMLAALLMHYGLAAGQGLPQSRREWRGAWLQTVFRDDYASRTAVENQAFLVAQLDSLCSLGFNAVIFQVRPQADAFYSSDIEPWSRFLTGRIGITSDLGWDLLHFMAEQCHKRGLELHAWINPYRITTAASEQIPASHIAAKHPERVVTYNKRKYFDPGQPANRQYIVKIVRDIVKRYDIDGIHFDDYFYPYPVKGVAFADSKSYTKYGDGMSLGDWRRRNVSLLVEEVSEAVAAEKPWVRFGISPFGIWRNKSSDPNGSDTNGLQNYDDLYADALQWAEAGTVDYLMPQLYWKLDHKVASYRVLARWWAEHADGVPIIIGQDVAVTTKENELESKIELQRTIPGVEGSTWWPGYAVVDNDGGIRLALRSIYYGRSLPIAWPQIDASVPKPVSKLRAEGTTLKWTAPKQHGCADDAVWFAVYRFVAGEIADFSDPAALVALTSECSYARAEPGFTYAVTSLSRTNIECTQPMFITLP